MDEQPFTVFYAWQSDRPAKTNRNLFQNAIEKALKRVAKEGVLDEAPRLDRDTKDVPGIPDIANTILEKIRNSAAIVADVTFMGSDGTVNGKLIPNPNVMIELGYSLSEIGWERIICVMNKHYGDESNLPFDLQNRRWPIAYDLPDDADEETRSKVKDWLTENLFRAIRSIAQAPPRKKQADLVERMNDLERIVSAISSTSPQLTRLEEKLSAVESAVSKTDENETEPPIIQLQNQLVDRVKTNNFNGVEYRQGMLTICITPQAKLAEKINLQDVEHSLQVRIPPLYASGWNHERYGDRFVTISKWQNTIDAVTELTTNGEINAVGHEVISVNRQYFSMGNVPEEIHCIPSVAFEKSIIQAVKSYLTAYGTLNIEPPFDVSIALINLGQSLLVVGSRIFPNGRILKSDDVFPPYVSITDPSEFDSPQNLARVLQPIFDFVWREYNYPRSLNYDGHGEWVGH